MTKILIEEATLKLAMEALNTTESDCGSRAWEREQEAITAIKQARALDKKAENARELGLDYEPVAWSDTKQSELNDWFLSLPTERQAVLLEDKWMLAGAAFLAGKTTPPAAQPAPEQYTALEQALTRLQKRYGELEAKVAAQPAQLAPVQVLQRYSPDGEGGMEVDSLGVYVKHQDVSNPPAQPAVPDAITDTSENPEYRAGWNDCRSLMLKGMK